MFCCVCWCVWLSGVFVIVVVRVPCECDDALLVGRLAGWCAGLMCAWMVVRVVVCVAAK